MHCFQSRIAGLACIAISLAGCKNSAGTASTSTPTPNATVTGLWTGTDSDSGLSLKAIIDSAGNMIVIRSDGVQFVGTLNGTVVPGTSITATLIFTTNGSTAVPGSWSLTPGTPTSVASSLADVAGSYTAASPGVPSTTPPVATIAISASGAMSGQDTTTGCVMSGTIGTSDTSINEYQVSYTLASCTTPYNALNGVTFSGLGYMDYSTTPAMASSLA